MRYHRDRPRGDEADGRKILERVVARVDVEAGIDRGRATGAPRPYSRRDGQTFADAVAAMRRTNASARNIPLPADVRAAPGFSLLQIMLSSGRTQSAQSALQRIAQPRSPLPENAMARCRHRSRGEPAITTERRFVDPVSRMK